MNRIIIALFALAFVQLVSSQTACSDARTALLNNITCLSATDVATVCSGTCRTIYNNFRSNCDNDTIASAYVAGFNARCSPCGMAQSAYIADIYTCSNASTRCTEKCRTLYEDYIKYCIEPVYGGNGVSVFIPCDDNADACKTALNALTETTVCATGCTETCRGMLNEIIIKCDTRTPAGDSATVDDLCDSSTTTGDACDVATKAVDDACFTLLGLGDNSTCTGTCGNQLATAAAACTTTSGGDIRAGSTTYNELCGFQAQCSASTQAFSASTCDYDQDNGDTSVICSGTCRSLFENILNSCPESYTTLRRQLNLACGGSGSKVLQASEIITLLLVAICAFNF